MTPDEKDVLLDFGCIAESITYLGDGVYAGYDRAQIWLICRRDDDLHYIALEPRTFESLARMGQSYRYIKLHEDNNEPGEHQVVLDAIKEC